jgi:glutamate formiminotransferase
MLECVVNVSEGRRANVIDAIAAAGAESVLDLHTDAHHHRTVLTLAGPDVERAALRVVRAAFASIDVTGHDGVHPRLGAVDVIPFVPLAGSSMEDAVAARNRAAARIGTELDVPCFLYGPERTLPEVRRRAFRDLTPDTGPREPHPTAGASCVGARPILVAYNLWLARPATLEDARRIAAEIRGPTIRALGLQLGDAVQVSCNLVAPEVTGPDAVFDAIDARAPVERAELVGLVPERVLASVPRSRWAGLNLAPETTIEARLSKAGLDGGRF